MESSALFEMKNKSLAISTLRVFAMISIVICHLLQYYESPLSNVFNVGVQIFILISGFLYGRKIIERNNWGGWFLKRIERIYVPYLIFVVIVLLCYTAFARDLLYPVGVISYILAMQGFFSIGGLGYLWFVTAILLCYLITPFLQWLKSFNHSLLFLILFCLLEWVDIHYFHLQGKYVALYAVGYFLANLNRVEFHLIGILSVIACLVMWLSYGVQLIDGISCPDLCSVSHCVEGLSVFYLFYLLFEIAHTKKKAPIALELTDNYSYYVYLVHGVIILGPFGFMSITRSALLDIIVVVIFIILFSIILKESHCLLKRVYQQS